MLNTRVLFGLFILSSVLLLPASHSVFGQQITDIPPQPDWPTDAVTVFLPLVVKPSTSPPPPPSSPLIINHTSVDLFSRIPERYITAARNLRMLFSDRSVGQNINEALDCLVAPSWPDAPAFCRRDYFGANWNWITFTQTDYVNNLVPARILFAPDSVRYNRANWTFEFRGGSWSELTQDFVQTLAPAYINSKDVLSYQFSYLNVDETDDIDDPNTGFFANNSNKYDIYDLEAYIDRYPNKTFFLWTTSLARGIGTQTATQFNNQMRQYGIDHGYFVFDVADIESHTENGAACYDNRDGVQYCNGANCENYPNDGQSLPAICQDYTTETDGGHLGSVSAGKVRIAKAFWVIMARIAGWDGISQ